MINVLTDQQVLANIATNVQRLRGCRSRYWLAKQVGSYPINIARIEEAKHMPNSALLARLAEALDTSADALLSVDAEKFSKTA